MSCIVFCAGCVSMCKCGRWCRTNLDINEAYLFIEALWGRWCESTIPLMEFSRFKMHLRSSVYLGNSFFFSVQLRCQSRAFGQQDLSVIGSNIKFGRARASTTKSPPSHTISRKIA